MKNNSKASQALRAAHKAFKIAKEKAYQVFKYSGKIIEVSWSETLRHAWGLFKNPVQVEYSELGEIDFNF